MNNDNISEVSSKTVSISKMVRNLKQHCQSASGGWDSISVRRLEKDVSLDAMKRWIELTISDGLIVLKKAEIMAKLKGHYYVETDDINHAFIVHKNGVNDSLPDAQSSSDLIPLDISNQVNGVNHNGWNSSPSE